MKIKTKLIVTSLVLAFSLGILSSQLFAQQESSLIADKGGKFHVDSSVLVGTTLLKSGMYKVQHIMEGNDHVIIFRVIRMNRYKNRWGMNGSERKWLASSAPSSLRARSGAIQN